MPLVTIRLWPKSIRTFLRGVQLAQKSCDSSLIFLSLSRLEFSIFTLCTSLEQEAPIKLFLNYQMAWLAERIEFDEQFIAQVEELKSKMLVWMSSEVRSFFEVFTSLNAADCSQLELQIVSQNSALNPALAVLKLNFTGKDSGYKVERACPIEFSKAQLPILPPTMYDLSFYSKMLRKIFEAAPENKMNLVVIMQPEKKEVRFSLPKENIELTVSSQHLYTEVIGESMSKASIRPQIAVQQPDQVVWEMPYKICKKLLSALEMELYSLRLRVFTTGEAAFERNISTTQFSVHKDFEDLNTPSKQSQASSGCATLRILVSGAFVKQ
jgi:hypothetical protein